MRILIVHNAYQQRGGEDAVVEAEARMLLEAGLDVTVEIVSNSSITGFSSRLAALVGTAYNPSRKSWMQALIARVRPDVVHIHNFFPLLTPAIHEAAAQSGVAVVQTIHNYRLICAAATLLRDGRTCEKCVSGGRGWGLVHRCYRGSLPGSAAVVAMQVRADVSRTWRRHVHRFIALTDFARQKLVGGGLPAQSIMVKPNFSPAQAPSTSVKRTGLLFVGRLSQEKGLAVALQAMTRLPHLQLTVIGDGPERLSLEAMAPPNTVFLGALTSVAVAEGMSKAEALVLPSIWYEGFPMTLLEASAHGLPVFASRIGGLPELIVDGVTGRLFDAGDASALSAAIRDAETSVPGLAVMGEEARSLHGAKFTPEANLPLLEAIYDEAITESRRQAKRPG